MWPEAVTCFMACVDLSVYLGQRPALTSPVHKEHLMTHTHAHAHTDKHTYIYLMSGSGWINKNTVQLALSRPIGITGKYMVDYDNTNTCNCIQTIACGDWMQVDLVPRGAWFHNLAQSSNKSLNFKGCFKIQLMCNCIFLENSALAFGTEAEIEGS